jgi:hypothetical protein
VAPFGELVAPFGEESPFRPEMDASCPCLID